jgi:chromosome segregation protein
MRLEKILLDGFKSFADKTEFHFRSPITAIVGPNGCGKSNVVDAVKWVLGEQSVKSLRSDQMADVIFGGSSSRKPLGSAEVHLFISNPDGSKTGKLPIDADEIQITRRIYKSGESEYRINNNVCRLKDLRELFMDTGVGTRAYSIIEQGQVEQIVSGSKIDRRSIFEEAAGISKYKAHKKEALRKLEHTEQNLLRLADIFGEVTKRLRSVKLQAAKARNYLTFTQRLKELQVNYWLAEYAKNQAQLTEKSSLHESAIGQLQHLDVEAARNDTLASKLGEEKLELEHKMSHTGNHLVFIQSKIDQHLQRIEFLRSRMTELQQRKENAGLRIKKLQEQEKVFLRDFSQYKQELDDCEKMLEEKNLSVEQTQKAIHQINEDCAALEAELEDNKSGIIDIVRRTAQLHNEIQNTSVYRNNLSTQKDRLTSRAKTAKAELEKLFAEKAQCRARLDDIEKVLAELHQSLDSKRQKAEEISALLDADNKRLSQTKELRSALNGELTVLVDMEKRYEGLNNGVKNILQNKPDYIEGLVAEIISADLEYANAVEAALEGKTDALVVNSAERLLADKQTIEKLEGRVNFIPLDKIEPFVDIPPQVDLQCPSVKGRLVEFIRADGKYAPLVWKLLGKAIVVDSVDAAIELAKEATGDYTFVTLKGESVSADGTMKLGPIVAPAGLISRKSRLRQLEESIAKIESEIETLNEKIQKSNREHIHIDKLCKDLRTAVYEANTEKMHISSKMTVCEQDIDRLKKEQPLIAGEIDLLEAQIAQSVQKEYDSKQKLQELEEVNRQRNQRIKELQTQHNKLKDSLQVQSSLLTDLKVTLGQAAEQSRSLKQIIENQQGQLRASRSACEMAQEEIRNSTTEIQNSQRDILNCEAAVSELFLEKEQNQKSNRVLYEEIEALLEQKKKVEELLAALRSKKSKFEVACNELKIELGQLEVKQQDLVQRVQEELQINLIEAYKNYTDSNMDWDKVREEIAELRGKIERLGNVNVEAIAEQQSLEDRHNFLSSQVEDLNSSRAQLQQLINRLNKTSREKFTQVFEQIRVHFQQIFRKLFGGGKADIVLEDSEDPLEAGIEVIAKPPGKETRSISLLSGGEKSMIAIALLFAVFKTRPTPFCFLDEIDAALDEANNERFNILLGEFQKDSQFIVITHSKRTMSVADELFGITMQTHGVSKKIGVRFDQFDSSTTLGAGRQEETAAVA